MKQILLSLEVPEKEFKNRVAQEFFLVARESAVGAFLTILVVIVTHWATQPAGQLAAWVAGASLALVLRAVSAQLYLAMDAAAKERWHGVLYGAQWIGFVAAAALEVAQRLRLTIAALTLTNANGQPVQVTFSVGVAEHHPGECSDVVTKHADLALYQTKESGRNRCILFAI
jgi:GGDEF domain-containing protein